MPEVPEEAASALFAQHGADQAGYVAQIRVRILRVPAGRMEGALQGLRRNPHIEFAEPDYLAEAALQPNDPYYLNGQQWHLGKIGAPQAWDISAGSTNVVVAVVDTGVNPNHPDLAGKVLPGYDFGDNDADAADGGNHGTMVAGALAALSNNGQGVAGVTWHSRILPVKVFGAADGGYASYSAIAQGITYAADRGARVINLSVAGYMPSAAMQSACDYAWSKGAVLVAAAGNDGTNVVVYPAGCSNVVGVSGTTSSDALASWSSYGPHVKLAAPGATIWTTYFTTNNSSLLYASASGTSFASPIAAGVAALLVSAKPGLSNSDIVRILLESADDLGGPGYDIYFGAGRVSAVKALLAAGGSTPTAPDTTAPTVSITSPTTGTTVGSTLKVYLAARDDRGVVRTDLYVDGKYNSTSTSLNPSFSVGTRKWSRGRHLLQAKSFDAAGNAGASPVVDVVKP